MSHTSHPPGAGKNSFDLIDADRFLSILAPEPGDTVLDAACGPGRYTLFLAGKKIPDLTIFAVDLWPEGIQTLERRLAQEALSGVRAQVADLSRSIPVDSDRVDICLMATVFHDLVEAGTDHGAMEEIRRVMKPEGRLVVVEFKKIEGPPGPPESIRLSPEELEARMAEKGFVVEKTAEVGEVLYLSVFRPAGIAE